MPVLPSRPRTSRARAIASPVGVTVVSAHPRASVTACEVNLARLGSLCGATSAPATGACVAASRTRTQTLAGIEGATRSPSTATSISSAPSRRANRAHGEGAGGSGGGASTGQWDVAAGEHHAPFDRTSSVPCGPRARRAKGRGGSLGDPVAVGRSVPVGLDVPAAVDGHLEVRVLDGLADHPLLVRNDDLPRQDRRSVRALCPVHERRPHRAPRADLEPQADGRHRDEGGADREPPLPRAHGGVPHVTRNPGAAQSTSRGGRGPSDGTPSAPWRDRDRAHAVGRPHVHAVGAALDVDERVTRGAIADDRHPVRAASGCP